MCRKALAILLLFGVGPVAGAGESIPAVVGTYRTPVIPSGLAAVVEIRTTAALEIRADGSARYAVTWFNGDGTEVPRRYAEVGRWALQGATLTLTLPLETGHGTVVYEVTTCARDIRFRTRPCSQWLHPVSSNLPTGYTWAVMKWNETPQIAPPNSALQRTGHDKVLGRGRVSAAPLRPHSARVLNRTSAVAELGS